LKKTSINQKQTKTTHNNGYLCSPNKDDECFPNEGQTVHFYATVVTARKIEETPHCCVLLFRQAFY